MDELLSFWKTEPLSSCNLDRVVRKVAPSWNDSHGRRWIHHCHGRYVQITHSRLWPCHKLSWISSSIACGLTPTVLGKHMEQLWVVHGRINIGHKGWHWILKTCSLSSRMALNITCWYSDRWPTGIVASFSCDPVQRTRSALELHASPYLATAALDHCTGDHSLTGRFAGN